MNLSKWDPSATGRASQYIHLQRMNILFLFFYKMY